MYNYYPDPDRTSAGIEKITTGQKVIYFKYNPDNSSYEIYEGALPPELPYRYHRYIRGEASGTKEKDTTPAGYSYKLGMKLEDYLLKLPKVVR